MFVARLYFFFSLHVHVPVTILVDVVRPFFVGGRASQFVITIPVHAFWACIQLVEDSALTLVFISQYDAW